MRGGCNVSTLLFLLLLRDCAHGSLFNRPLYTSARSLIFPSFAPRRRLFLFVFSVLFILSTPALYTLHFSFFRRSGTAAAAAEMKAKSIVSKPEIFLFFFLI